MNVKKTEKAPFWMGLIAIAVGILPIALGAEPTSGTPMWVVYGACSVFVFAGLIIIFPKPAHIGGPFIILIFTAMFTWIGFSPDAKGCSSSVSFGIFTKTKSTGCEGFRFFAIIMWLVVAGILFAWIKKMFKKKED